MIIVLLLAFIGSFLFGAWTRTKPSGEFLAWNLSYDAALAVFCLLFAPVILVVVPFVVGLDYSRYRKIQEAERQAGIKPRYERPKL